MPKKLFTLLLALVGMILDPTTVSDMADVTGDGDVDLEDVTALVNMLLGQ